jgi:TonB family protein
MIDTLAAVLSRFWVGMAVHLWQSALFIGLLGLVALALRRTSARTLSVLYWVGVLKLLLPLPLLGPLSDRLLASITGAPDAAASGAAWTVSVLMYPAVLESGPAGWAGPPSGTWIVLSSIWILGAVVILARRVRSAWTRRRLPMGRSNDASEKLRAAISDAGLSPGVIRVGGASAAPFVAGSLRPIIVVPRAVVERLDRDELHAVLIHEGEHLRRRDPLRYSVLSAVRAAFWFYPPVWWLVRRIRETTEMACDEAVVGSGLSSAIYCRSVARVLSLGLTQRHSVSSVGILGHRSSFLTRRLERIRSGRRLKSMYSHRLTVAASALAAVVLSLLPFAPVTSVRAGDEIPQQRWDQLEEADLPVMLNFQEARADKIFEALGATSGVEFRVDDEIENKVISVNLGRMSLKQALMQLGVVAGAGYTILGQRVIEVNPILLAGTADVTRPKLIPESKVNPRYPEEARANGIQGRVILQALIDSSGNVGSTETLTVEPADYEPFVKSAVEALSKWRYEPATSNGKPVDVYFTIRMEFKLNGDGKGKDI